MKKSFSIIAAFIAALFILPFGNTVLADGKTYDDIEDGEYEITAKAINADTGERSGAAGFINEDAQLSIHDGRVNLIITIPNNPMAEIKGLQIEGIEPNVEEFTDKKQLNFELTELKSDLNAQVQYVVPSMNMNHNVPFKFVLEGLDELPVKEDPENNEGDIDDSDSTKEDPPQDSEQNDSNEEEKADENSSENSTGSLIENADETYKVEFITSSSATKRYFKNPATLIIKNSKKYIQMSGTSGNIISSLSINGIEVNWGEIDEQGNFIIQFELPGDLNDELDFGMVISPPGMDDMEHTVSLSFEKGIENPEAETEPEPEKESKPDPKPIKKPMAPEEKGIKAFEIDYVIKHETDDAISAADKFFRKPATLLEKDGEKYLQITVDNWDWIQYIRTSYGDVDIVQINKEDGSALIQFRVGDDLNDAIVLDMHIIVPKEVAGMEYDMKHSARLFLDPTSMEEIDASGYEVIVENGGGNGDNGGDSSDNDKTPAKPAFTNGNGDDGNSMAGAKTTGTNNPKTADTSNVLFFTLLLIGSLIPLTIKLRRHFA